MEFDPVGRQLSEGVAIWLPGHRENTSGQRSLRFGISNVFVPRPRQSFKELAPDIAASDAAAVTNIIAEAELSDRLQPLDAVQLRTGLLSIMKACSVLAFNIFYSLNNPPLYSFGIWLIKLSIAPRSKKISMCHARMRLSLPNKWFEMYRHTGTALQSLSSVH